MADSGNSSYSLLASTRYDEELLNVPWNTRVNGGTPSRFMLLPYHYDRLAAAIEQHRWTVPQQHLTRTDLSNACDDAVAAARDHHGQGPFKIRILLTPDGQLNVSAIPISQPGGFDIHSTTNNDAPVRIVYIDPEPTSPSLYTSTKTTNRFVYNAARARFGLSPMPTPEDAHIDVLLHSSDGLAMETSIRNAAFFRGNTWVTPSAPSGCCLGVMRRLMLEEGRVVEGVVNIDDVIPGEVIMTSNGVEGIQFAKVALCPPDR